MNFSDVMNPHIPIDTAYRRKNRESIMRSHSKISPCYEAKKEKREREREKRKQEKERKESGRRRRAELSDFIAY